MALCWAFQQVEGLCIDRYSSVLRFLAVMIMHTCMYTHTHTHTHYTKVVGGERATIYNVHVAALQLTVVRTCMCPCKHDSLELAWLP